MSLLVLLGCSDPEDPGQRGNQQPRDDAGQSPDGGGDDGGPPQSARSCANTACDPNAICDDEDGTAACACLPGFTGDGENCEDVDECETDNGGCDEHALCLNRPGFRRCVCEEGWTGDGETCTDTDECADLALNTCDPNATCSNDEEGFACECGDGTSGDGFGCADIDECADEDAFECGTNATCKNTFGGYECECGAGFTGTADDCVSLCDVTPAPCAGNRLCRVLDAAADCNAAACEPGFVGDGATCTSVADGDACDPCDGQGDDDVAGGVCTGTAGAGTCSCAPGYTGTFPDCVDIDECATDNGGCGPVLNFECRNLPGGYACGCQPEFTGANCTDDVNECEQDPGPCHPNALCTNTTRAEDDPATTEENEYSPAFICNCRPGYTGDGSVCRDVDECEDGDDNCLDDGTARCLNTAGSFECRCRRGYTGDGVEECENLDECEDPELNDCAEMATCTDDDPEDNPFGYECTCPAGLGGDGTECSDVNECQNAALNQCAEHSTCVNEEGGYRCECRPPFAGDDPNECHCDLSGYWAMRQDVDSCWCDRTLLDLTLVSGGVMEATTWELHRYVYDGDTLTVEKMGCGADNSPDLVSPHFKETFSSYIPDETFFELDMQRGADVEESGIVPGSAFMTGEEAAVLGIDLGDDPTCDDCWPATIAEINPPGDDPPAWIDAEGDGQPGVTLWPRMPSETPKASSHDYYNYMPVNVDDQGNPTVRAGCVSAATRVITRLEGDVQTCNRIVGEVINVRTEGRVHSCTRVPMSDWDDDIECGADAWSEMAACDEGDVMRLNDQDQSQRATASFELIKIGDLDDPVDCADVRSALPAFERATATPITCDCP